jgi:putative ABC transport system permease protein
MLFVEVILNNVLRRKTRSVLTALGLAVAVAATTALVSIAWDYANSAARYYQSRNVDIVVVRAGVAERINSSLKATFAARLLALPGVSEVDFKLTEMVSLGEGSLIGIPLHGIDPVGFTAAKTTIQAGRMLQATDRHAVLLGASLAESLGKQAGQRIEIEEELFQVVGLFQGVDALESNTVMAPLADVQALMDRPGQVSEFQLRVAPTIVDDAALHDLCRKIETLRDDQEHSLGLKALPTQQFVNTDTETQLTSAMAWGTSTVAVVLSTVGMLNTMLMSVFERTRELGILRAIGWSRSRIVRLIVGESLVLSLVGVLTGSGAAWALVRGLSAWSVTRTIVHPNLSPTAVLCGAVIAIAAVMGGSLYPAYRGASIPAVEALRYE